MVGRGTVTKMLGSSVVLFPWPSYNLWKVSNGISPIHYNMDGRLTPIEQTVQIFDDGLKVVIMQLLVSLFCISKVR